MFVSSSLVAVGSTWKRLLGGFAALRPSFFFWWGGGGGDGIGDIHGHKQTTKTNPCVYIEGGRRQFLVN